MTERKSIDDFGYAFIPGDEYRYRNVQNGTHPWRHLTPEETIRLQRNGNDSSRWNDVLVTTPFDPDCIQGSTFYGLVRIGILQKALIQFHDLAVPEGIRNSVVISCDIGDHVSVSGCGYLSHYIIGDQVIIHDVSEMQTTNHAKFGVGVVKEGEDESVRITISVMNESEGRAVRPFVSLTTGDAWLWAKYRDDKPLMRALEVMTDRTVDLHRGWYGKIGEGAVIKETRIIKDVNIGPSCYIKGANKLKNLTILSRDDEPTQLGEGIELVNGIVGYGSRIFYGCKAVRFVLGDWCTLKYGARMLNTILGDNSTVSCCEMLSNLIFPGHEQHHNTSFLIASCIKGQSNMAAGANIGSNHNSRGADGELVAGRGFWPALSSTLKYDSSFASFTLITKGNYPHELHIPLPFCLISSDTTRDERVLMPAYWWMYNLYALERNSWKYAARDKRKHPRIFYETDYLAPDTAGEIMKAMKLLEQWSGSAWANTMDVPVADPSAIGLALLRSDTEDITRIPVYGEGLECSATPIRIIKVREGWRAYRTMLSYYGMKTLVNYLALRKENLMEFDAATPTETTGWTNVGGILVPNDKLENLKGKIKNGEIATWDGVHDVFAAWYATYPADRAKNAISILRSLTGKAHLSSQDWDALCRNLTESRSFIEKQVFLTKKKDYENPFRMITYDTKAERDEVLGKVDDNPFVTESKILSRTILQDMEIVRARE
ncbi:MAG: DUF4954 family protein [Sphaerochaetaceae bacterium]